MTQPGRHRVLFVAEAVTLAHVARPMVLAGALDPLKYEVFIACDPRSHALLAKAPATVVPIESIASREFLERLAQGKPLYQLDELERYVIDDRRLLEEIKPDLVVGDFRLSLGVSAALAGTPYANITNAHWSPHTREHRFPLPEHVLARVLGPGLGQALFNLAQPIAFGVHAKPINRLRQRHGLKPLPGLLAAYTQADHILYADVPELAPLDGLAAHEKFIGPVLWSPDVALPDWWSRLSNQPPPIYLTLGSSGQIDLLPMAVQALSAYPGQVMVATAGKLDRASLSGGNLLVADYLPGIEAAGRSSIVVCNGGSAPVYQALSQGTPVIGIASNMDQYLMMRAVTARGAGILIRSGQFTAVMLQSAVTTITSQDSYRRAAGKLADAIAAVNTAGVFARFVESVVR